MGHPAHGDGVQPKGAGEESPRHEGLDGVESIEGVLCFLLFFYLFIIIIAIIYLFINYFFCFFFLGGGVGFSVYGLGFRGHYGPGFRF